jgi:hypothetical protein
MFNKLELGAKNSAKSRAWYGTKVHQRRTDPLLQQARNADEHGLEFVTEKQPGSVRQVLPRPFAQAVAHGTHQTEGLVDTD